MPHTRLPVRVTGLAALLGLATALLTAAPASAAPDWDTVSRLEDARLQACKVPVDGGDAWRVRLRVRNGNDYRVRSTVRVYRGNTPTGRVWRSGWVAEGDGAAGRVRTGTGAAWRISYRLGADEAGSGGSTPVRFLGRC